MQWKPTARPPLKIMPIRQFRSDLDVSNAVTVDNRAAYRTQTSARITVRVDRRDEKPVELKSALFGPERTERPRGGT